MPNYIVFGGCLESPFEFAQLPKADDGVAPTWAISEVPETPSIEDATLLGENRITSKATVRLYRHAGGFRLRYDDSGTFDLSPDGALVSWARGPDTDLNNVREDVLGPVLAMAMHLSGRLCLHGSSVVLPGGAIAFLAPKHFGKSTIAMALLSRGARLLTDDSLPVVPGPPVMACPGVASVRFWDDTRDRFHTGGKTIKGSGGKYAATDLADKAQLHEMQPLEAVYLLAPFEPTEGCDAVRRQRPSDIECALALVQHAKIGALLGKSEGPVMLDRAASIAREAPVYVLRVVSDIERIDEVVGQLLAWHTDEGAGSGDASSAMP